MLTKRLDRPLNVKIDQATLNDLESISRRLGLDKSEIARRALRVGLREFHGAELPGSPDMVRQKKVSKEGVKKVSKKVSSLLLVFYC